MCRGVYARARLDSPTPVDPTRQQLGGSRRRAGSLSSEPSPLCLPTPDGRRAGAISTRPSQSTITEDHNASPQGLLTSSLPGVWSPTAVMEPLEVAITILFDALLLVFMVKLFFAMFQMKLVVILFYLVILLFAMAFSGRAPSSF